MPANPNWARWIFASVADHLKQVAIDNNIPVLVEHLDDRTQDFMRATDRVEIRITGPYTQMLSKDDYRIWVDANVLLTSRYDGSQKNAYTIVKLAGLYHEAMDGPIGIWNFGNEPGDYDANDPDTQMYLGCLRPRAGNDNSISVFHFGQIDKTDKLKQSAVDARYVMNLGE